MSSQIYFEAQDDAFQLCGQHSLNNLLQGAYFTAFDLGAIGAKLDEQEAMLYNDSTKSLHKQNCYKNVSLSGSFSIDVLIAALNTMNLTAMSLSHPQCCSVKHHPQTEQAFLINYDGHWMSYRKISNIWYNLNSIANYAHIEAQPVHISDFYLTATLSKLQNNGFQIFVIRGTFPKNTDNAPKMNELKHEYKWYEARDINTHNKLHKLSTEISNKQRENNYVFEQGFHIKWNIKPLQTKDINVILKKQNYLCASCGCRLVSNFLSKKSYLLCQYLGNMHCIKCHKRDKSVIPSQVLNTLNCKALNVCVYAKAFLDKMYFIPCISMDMFNGKNKKIGKNKKLQKLKQLLFQLMGMKGYIDGNEGKCMNGKKLLKNSYIYDGLLSLNDIVNVFSSNTLNKLETFSNKLQRHIIECDICKLKGNVCEICKDANDKIYTFSIDDVVECSKCNTKYHETCWNSQCVKCD